MTAKVWTAARAALILGAGIFVIGLVSGLLYGQAQRARDREHFPQVGRSVDIGGRMLNIYCLGAGQPSVILASGANWPLNSAVQGPKTIFSNGRPRRVPWSCFAIANNHRTPPEATFRRSGEYATDRGVDRV
jgi:hypothetical protein